MSMVATSTTPAGLGLGGLLLWISLCSWSTVNKAKSWRTTKVCLDHKHLCLLVKSIEGTHAGKHECFAKLSIKLFEGQGGLVFIVFCNSLSLEIASSKLLSEELQMVLQCCISDMLFLLTVTPCIDIECRHARSEHKKEEKRSQSLKGSSCILVFNCFKCTIKCAMLSFVLLLHCLESNRTVEM
jgi:hypothetical protein